MADNYICRSQRLNATSKSTRYVSRRRHRLAQSQNEHGRGCLRILTFGMRAGVSGTSRFIINGFLLSGALSEAAFEKLLAEQLSERTAE